MRGSTPLDPLGFGPLPNEVIEEIVIECEPAIPEEVAEKWLEAAVDEGIEENPVFPTFSPGKLVFKPISPSPKVERMQQAIEKFQRDVMSQLMLTGNALVRQHVDTENKTIKRELLKLDPADRERFIHGEFVMEPEADSKNAPKPVKKKDVNYVLAQVGIERQRAGKELIKLITATLSHHTVHDAIVNTRRYLKS